MPEAQYILCACLANYSTIVVCGGGGSNGVARGIVVARVVWGGKDSNGVVAKGIVVECVDNGGHRRHRHRLLVQDEAKPVRQSGRSMSFLGITSITSTCNTPLPFIYKKLMYILR